MKLQNIAVIVVAVGTVALLLRYQARLEQTFFKATQYGASWEPLPQDAGKVIYV